jgi:hypothetical protein
MADQFGPIVQTQPFGFATHLAQLVQSHTILGAWPISISPSIDLDVDSTTTQGSNR